MSSSCPESRRRARSRLPLVAAPLIGYAIFASVSTVNAQATDPGVRGDGFPGFSSGQTYTQPRLEASVTQNTNRNLAIDPEQEADILGYIVTAETLWGYVTPRTHTRVQPRLRFQHYPDDDDAQRSEQFLDFSTVYRATERSTLNVMAHISREDTVTSELGTAEFDDFDPDDPTDEPGISRVTGRDTRTRAHLRPEIRHQLSERDGLLVNGILQTVRYKSDLFDYTDYDYAELRALVTRNLTQRTSASVGPMVSVFEARDNQSQTEGYGLDFNLVHVLSELTRLSGGVFVRRSDIEFVDGAVVESASETDYGFDFGILMRTQLGQVRLSMGRSVQPSSFGTTVIRNEVRAQYDHDFSERLSGRTAVRAYSLDRRNIEAIGTNRDHARGEFELSWMLTPTMFVRGRYEYTWREIARDDASADNHAIMVSFGYRGLGRPR